MAIRSVILVAVTALVFGMFLQTASAAAICFAPEADEIERLLEETMRTLSLDMFTFEVNMTMFNPVCYSVSNMKGRYRIATILVRFVFDSDALFFNECPRNTQCDAFFNIECSEVTWSVSRVSISASITILMGARQVSDSDFLTPPGLDCGLCTDASFTQPPSVHDSETNCVLCDPACQGVGLSYCTGLTSSSCCSFYEPMGTCVSQCPAGSVADVNFDCITGCDLSCENGRPNSNCTMCVCDEGFTGANCSINFALNCEGASCVNGNCTPTISGFTCDCNEGFSGDLCDSQIDFCIGVDCNNGECINGEGNFTCNCSLGYTGEYCNVSVDDCVGVTCRNMGTCVDGHLSSNCSCKPNFAGDFCELCDLPNCMTCSFVTNVCSMCDSGYVTNNEGTCVESCSEFICQNGGTCLYENMREMCICPEGFEGTNCQTNIDECAERPCENSLLCVDLVNDFFCRCRPGFTGKRCQIDLNSCPCINGGNCSVSDTAISFNCTCPPNFEGDICQNCTIENCRECSKEVEGVCIKCSTNYMLDDQNQCILDPDAFCSSSPDPLVCRYLLAMEEYSEIAPQCGLDVTETPTSPPDATPLEVYETNLGIYTDQFPDWLQAADAAGINTASLALPSSANLEGTTDEQAWRIQIQNWYEAMERFIDFLPNSDEFSLPDVDIDNGDTEGIYSLLLPFWFELVDGFDSSLCVASS